MQIILVKYVQLFCVTLFFSDNIKCDQLLLKNDNEDNRIYMISACTGRCVRDTGSNSTLEQCYENCIDKISTISTRRNNDRDDNDNNETFFKQPKKVYHNLEVKFLCRDDTSFVIEIVNSNFEDRYKKKYDLNNFKNNSNSDRIELESDDNEFLSYKNISFNLVNGENEDHYNDAEKNFKNNNNGTKYNNDNNVQPNQQQQFQIYVLKIHEEDKFPIEKQIYLTNSSLIRIDKLKPNTKYYVSATVVTPNNEYSLIANGITYSTLKKKYTPKEISNVRVNYIPDELSSSSDVLSAYITWSPAIDQTCYYDIIVYSPDSMMNGFDLPPIEIRDIENLYTYTIRNLLFGTQYQLAIRGKNTKDLSRESDLIWHSIQTPSCLEWYQNLTICPPQKPLNLDAHEQHISSNLFSLNVSWEKPDTEYLPNYYLLKIRDLHRNTISVNTVAGDGPDHDVDDNDDDRIAGSELNTVLLNISNDHSSIFIPEIKFYGFEYEVNLTAISDGGMSSSIIMVSINDYIQIPDKFDYMKRIFTISISIICFACILSIILVMLLRRIKINRLKERCKYLEELEQKNTTIKDTNVNFDIALEKVSQICGIGGDNCFDINQLQYNLQEKLYINDEKEIKCENVQLYEVLGEGAFGLVRRGILKLQTNDQNDDRNQNKSIEVAVKTLKDQPTSDDIKAFRREIDVMKSVGYHPNIVGLIGHCTKNLNAFMLLTEYCTLGNLQNYLKSEWRYLNKINYRNKMMMNQNNTKRSSLSSSPTKSAEIQKKTENIFNYNNSSIDKRQMQYKNILCNENGNSIPSSCAGGSGNDQYIPGDNHVGKVLPQNLVINKGYEFNGITCTNSCKSKVDVILKNHDEDIKQDHHNNPENNIKTNDYIFYNQDEKGTREIEIQNCDCAKNVSKPKDISTNSEQSNTKINEENTKKDNEKIPKKLSSNSRQPISSADLLLIAKQISLGMEFLAKNKVVHRDLAARNVLVCADHTVKIADFGLSRDVYQENIYKKTGSGKLPIKWLALESMTHQIYTSQSDVWSFGILLYEIVTLGETPYPSISNSQLLDLLKSGYRMDKPKSCGPKLYDLMLSCWQTNPSNRPTFTEIVKIIDEFLMNKPEDHIFGFTSSEFKSNKSVISSLSSFEESYLKPINLN